MVANSYHIRSPVQILYYQSAHISASPQKGFHPRTRQGASHLRRYCERLHHLRGLWYRAPASDPDDWSVLLDERELAANSEYFTLGGISVSDDGKKMAYSIDLDGSERFELFIVDIETGDEISPSIKDTLGEAVWDSQSTGLIYVLLNEHWRPFKVL